MRFASPRSLRPYMHVCTNAVEGPDCPEIDDARHCVRAIDGGGAARDRIDAFDDRVGKNVDVDVAADVGDRQSLAVEQNQVAIGAQAMKVDGRAAAGALSARCRALPPTVKPGNWLSASTTLATPLCFIASSLTETMGLTAVLFPPRWISEPVTTTSAS